GADPHVEVFDAATTALLRSFDAYDSGFTGGIYVSSFDVTGDGFADIVTGAGTAPHVKVFQNNPVASTDTEITSFLAYGSGFNGGARIGAGDTNNDGRADLFVAPGKGPSVPEVSFDALTAAQVDSFFAFGTSTIGAFTAGGR